MDPVRDKTEHLLTLKVMRLMKPSLINSVLVTTDVKDLPGNLLNNYLKSEITSVPGSETISSGQFMLLPQCFGSIYLGETFSSYICVHNDSNQIAKDVTVKAVLQTQTFELMLSRDAGHSTDLEPGKTINEVLHHEVKEFGPHVLVCEVSYCCGTLTSDQLSFRKFFKFDVLKPLDVKTKLYTAESDEVYLEAQIQNTIAGPVTLEHVSLEASNMFKVTQLDPPCADEDINRDIVKANCSRQFLYRLVPVPALLKNLKLLSGTTSIGKLDIVWRTNMGERGRLQTSPLHRVAPNFSDLRISVIEMPEIAFIDTEFTMTCRLVNNSETVIDLAIELTSSDDIKWTSESKGLCYLEPNHSLNVIIRLTALNHGLLGITGLSFKDITSQRKFDYEELTQIYVIKTDSGFY